jgi:hypothetical protein
VRQSLSLSRGLSSWTTWTTGLFAFFFIISAVWVAEFFALPFRRAQDQGRELAGAANSNAAITGQQADKARPKYPERERKKIGIGVMRNERILQQRPKDRRGSGLKVEHERILHRLRLVRHVLSRGPQTC